MFLTYIEKSKSIWHTNFIDTLKTSLRIFVNIACDFPFLLFNGTFLVVIPFQNTQAKGACDRPHFLSTRNCPHCICMVPCVSRHALSYNNLVISYSVLLPFLADFFYFRQDLLHYTPEQTLSNRRRQKPFWSHAKQNLLGVVPTALWYVLFRTNWARCSCSDF